MSWFFSLFGCRSWWHKWKPRRNKALNQILSILSFIYDIINNATLLNSPPTVPIVPTRLPLVCKHHFPNSSHPPPPPSSWQCSKSVLQSVLAHHSYLCHSPSNRCQRCGGHTTCVATAKMRPRDTYGREGSRTITICPLGDRTCTHRSKEVAVPAGPTVVPFNPAMAWRN